METTNKKGNSGSIQRARYFDGNKEKPNEIDWACRKNGRL
jgi:hypothetical protein